MAEPESKLDIILLEDVELRDAQNESAYFSPLNKYIYVVQTIIHDTRNDDFRKNSIPFFRGQSDKSWDVEPSVFRNNLLCAEHELIREAVRHRPDGLANSLTNFERLTKLQHYEMPTRLLDVTENPLIALYFACEAMPEHDAAVYMTHTYPIYSSFKEAQILSYIAHLDLTGVCLRDLWTGLKKERVDLPDIEAITDGKVVDNFIELIQRNYFVRANLNNQRIKQQSGAFLLSGCVKTLADRDVWSSRLEKSSRCLADEFTHKIIIPAGLKAQILEELDLYHINEASIYPELDHQLRYIKDKVARANVMYSTPDHTAEAGLVELESGPEIELLGETEEETSAPAESAPDWLREVVSRYIPSGEFGEPVCDIFASRIKVDWTDRKQIQADISRNITRYLYQHEYDSDIDVCARLAKAIVGDAAAGQKA